MSPTLHLIDTCAALFLLSSDEYAETDRHISSEHNMLPRCAARILWRYIDFFIPSCNSACICVFILYERAGAGSHSVNKLPLCNKFLSPSNREKWRRRRVAMGLGKMIFFKNLSNIARREECDAALCAFFQSETADNYYCREKDCPRGTSNFTRVRCSIKRVLNPNRATLIIARSPYRFLTEGTLVGLMGL
jgi:hypothetical protein